GEVARVAGEEGGERKARTEKSLDPGGRKGEVELLAGPRGELLAPPFPAVGLVHPKRARLGRAGVHADVPASGQFLECARGELENARLLLLLEAPLRV